MQDHARQVPRSVKASLLALVAAAIVLAGFFGYRRMTAPDGDPWWLVPTALVVAALIGVALMRIARGSNYQLPIRVYRPNRFFDNAPAKIVALLTLCATFIAAAISAPSGTGFITQPFPPTKEQLLREQQHQAEAKRQQQLQNEEMRRKEEECSTPWRQSEFDDAKSSAERNHPRYSPEYYDELAEICFDRNLRVDGYKSERRAEEIRKLFADRIVQVRKYFDPSTDARYYFHTAFEANACVCPRRAVDELTLLAASFPKYAAPAHGMKASILVTSLRQPEQALVSINAAISTDNDPGYRRLRGQCLAALKQYKEAAADFEAAHDGANALRMWVALNDSTQSFRVAAESVKAESMDRVTAFTVLWFFAASDEARHARMDKYRPTADGNKSPLDSAFIRCHEIAKSIGMLADNPSDAQRYEKACEEDGVACWYYLTVWSAAYAARGDYATATYFATRAQQCGKDRQVDMASRFLGNFHQQKPIRETDLTGVIALGDRHPGSVEVPPYLPQSFLRGSFDHSAEQPANLVAPLEDVLPPQSFHPRTPFVSN